MLSRSLVHSSMKHYARLQCCQLIWPGLTLLYNWSKACNGTIQLQSECQYMCCHQNTYKLMSVSSMIVTPCCNAQVMHHDTVTARNTDDFTVSYDSPWYQPLYIRSWSFYRTFGCFGGETSPIKITPNKVFMLNLGVFIKQVWNKERQKSGTLPWSGPAKNNWMILTEANQMVRCTVAFISGFPLLLRDNDEILRAGCPVFLPFQYKLYCSFHKTQSN